MSNARVLGQHVLWFPSCVVQVVIPVPKLMFSVPLCSMLHKFFLLVVSCIYIVWTFVVCLLASFLKEEEENVIRLRATCSY